MLLLVFVQLHCIELLVTFLAFMDTEGIMVKVVSWANLVATCFNCWFILNYPMKLCDCRTSLAFRLMPQGNAVLDCSPIAAAGHVIPQSYVPISVSQFMDDLSAEEDIFSTRPDNNNFVSTVLCDRRNACLNVYADAINLFIILFIFTKWNVR